MGKLTNTISLISKYLTIITLFSAFLFLLISLWFNHQKTKIHQLNYQLGRLNLKNTSYFLLNRFIKDVKNDIHIPYVKESLQIWYEDKNPNPFFPYHKSIIERYLKTEYPLSQLSSETYEISRKAEDFARYYFLHNYTDAIEGFISDLNVKSENAYIFYNPIHNRLNYNTVEEIIYFIKDFLSDNLDDKSKVKIINLLKARELKYPKTFD